MYLQAMQATFGQAEQMIALLPRAGGVEDKVPVDGVVPADIVRALARLRLLEGVPFSYLVPDAELIPAETIRFFYLDRNATDALVAGALSVGTVNESDRRELAELYQRVRSEVDTAERLVRMKDSDAPAVDAAGRPIGAGGQITGFLLRSQLVSGWPGLHVRAYSVDNEPDDKPVPDVDPDANRMRVLRMERLAPAVLLALFDGVPAVVHIEEPRAGIQFGVRLDATTNPAQPSAVVPVRNANDPNSGPVQLPNHQDRTVDVPFRQDSPGVINMTALAAALAAAPGSNITGGMDAAKYALQMLRFPLRQVFGDTARRADPRCVHRDDQAVRPRGELHPGEGGAGR